MPTVNGDAPLPPTLAPHSFAEWLRGWRYFFWFLAGLLVIVLFYAEENWRGSLAWARYQREMKARGEWTNWKDFIPPPVPEEQNFAMTPLLRSAFGARSLLGFKTLSAAMGLAGEYDSNYRGTRSKLTQQVNTWVGPTAGLTVWRAVLLKATNQTVVPRERLVATNFTVAEAAEAVLTALADCEPVFLELRDESRRPNSRFNLAYEQADPASILLPHLSVLKQLSQLAWLRASAELALGRNDAAFEHAELTLRLAEATRTEPILVTQLVRAEQFRMALQLIAHGISVWSEEHLRALRDHLVRFNFCAANAHALRSERSFFAARLIEYVRHREDQPNVLGMYGSFGGKKQLAGLEWAGLLMAVMPEGWFDLEHLNHSRMFQDYLLPTIDATNCLVSPSASHRAEKCLDSLLDHSAAGLLLRHRLFCRLMLPSVSEIALKTATTQSAADMAALACALELYQRRHGQFPDTLALLVPEFIAQLPHDVINGRPLNYRRTEDGLYVLYSVGWNQTDDSGEIVFGKSGEVDWRLGDWVWRPGSR